MINLVYLIGALVIFAADRLSKLWVISRAEVGETIAEIGNSFSLMYVQNRGAAFSMLSGRLGFLSIISVVFCIGVVVYWFVKKPKDKLLCAALAMMAAGALGNAADRLIYGYVIDFIKTEFINFPVFNIADIAITAGAALLVVSVCLEDRKNGEKK
ncbi:MAG: signal peptidase II [bacterium]|nr:signal peptidase II [bacterium]